MSLVWTDELPLTDELGRFARSVKQDGPLAWQFELPSDAALRATARVDPDWILFDIPLRRGRSRQWPEAGRLIELLELNAALPPDVKFVWNRLGQRLHLQAELPQGSDGNPLARLDALFDGFHAALDAYQSLPIASKPGESRSDHTDGDVESAIELPATDGPNGMPITRGAGSPQQEGTSERRDDWKRLCGETGWVCHERAGNRLAVSLDVPGSFVAAMLEPHNGDALRARIELDADFPSRVAKKGAAAMLLAAGRVVRMARTWVSGDWRNGAMPRVSECSEDDSGAASIGSPESSDNGKASATAENHGASAAPAKYGWDVVFGETPAAFELDRGLSALSMAARLTLGEMRVLADDRVARRFLAVQGMVP